MILPDMDTRVKYFIDCHLGINFLQAISPSPKSL
jgi:hypothetical protein